MKNALMLVMMCSILSISSPVFSQETPDPRAWTGNVNLFLGAKLLEKKDWEPVDQQLEGGILFDLRQNRWPISIALDVLYAKDSEDVGVAILDLGILDTRATATTAEVNIGIRKVWEVFGFVRPFIGGGFAVIHAELETQQLGVSLSDKDTGYGAWADLGVYFTISKRFNLGIDGRWSRAGVDVFETSSKGGGWHIGGLAGYHW